VQGTAFENDFPAVDSFDLPFREAFSDDFQSTGIIFCKTVNRNKN
jgi:hypothetical protein